MISDKQRREVARNLREDADNDKLREQVFVEEIIVGCVGETMHDEWGNVREIEILTRLADLIDRPTTTVTVASGDDDSDLCIKCNSCCRGWHISKYDKSFSYCPKCGAEVMRNDY